MGKYSTEAIKQAMQMKADGMPVKDIYDRYWSGTDLSMESFARKLRMWSARANEKTLDNGTYSGFIAHGATVQIDGDGKITQAWIKQSVEDDRFEELLDTVRKGTSPLEVKIQPHSAYQMLEIPLLDMHFPFSDYLDVLSELVRVIRDEWAEINIVVGQDVFHNDTLTTGRTTSGREIEKVDIPAAWRMADEFFTTLISEALQASNRVNLIFSLGNHDETLSWAFFQMLKVKFPQAFSDDSLLQRKCIFWNGCFIGVTHGHYAKNTTNDLRSQFTIEFPMEFARAKVREIHAGHYHHEESVDTYGITVRRLSSAVPTDSWNYGEGYVGAHKRFMVFVWEPNKLDRILFI